MTTKKKSQREDTSLSGTKQYDKVVELLSDKEAREVINMGKDELEKLIVDAQMYEHKVRTEKEATTGWKVAKEDLRELNAGERELINPIKAKKALAVLALQSLRDNPIAVLGKVISVSAAPGGTGVAITIAAPGGEQSV
jgi:hypothetical protein